MTKAQFDLIVKLAGGLNEAGAAAVSAGLLVSTRSNKRDRTNALMGIATTDASQLIESLGGRPLVQTAPTQQYNLVSEGYEDSAGVMHDRGEDN